jgi:hypothetical protein
MQKLWGMKKLTMTSLRGNENDWKNGNRKRKLTHSSSFQ